VLVDSAKEWRNPIARWSESSMPSAAERALEQEEVPVGRGAQHDRQRRQARYLRLVLGNLKRTMRWRHLAILFASVIVLGALGSCAGAPGASETTTSFANSAAPETTDPVPTTVASAESSPPPVSTGVAEYDELLAKHGLQPIEGCGDYSAYDSAWEPDRAETTARMAECVQDQGFPVTVDGASIGFASVPPDQNELAYATMIACRVGLKLPIVGPLTEEQLKEAYAYQVALLDCYAENGYPGTEPPISLDVFIELEGAWQALDIIGAPGPGEAWDELNRRCPQTPVGGYGAWNPGDPVAPQS